MSRTSDSSPITICQVVIKIIKATAKSGSFSFCFIDHPDNWRPETQKSIENVDKNNSKFGNSCQWLCWQQFDVLIHIPTTSKRKKVVQLPRAWCDNLGNDSVDHNYHRTGTLTPGPETLLRISKKRIQLDFRFLLFIWYLKFTQSWPQFPPSIHAKSGG